MLPNVVLRTAQKELVGFCKEHNIRFNSYSPLGIPDDHAYPSSISTTGKIIEEPRLLPVAKKHGLSPAQLLLAWQWGQGIVSNPRSMSAAHMLENLAPSVTSTKVVIPGLYGIDI